MSVKGSKTLTSMQRQFVNNLIRGQKIGAAAMSAGYASVNAGSALLKHEPVKALLRKKLEQVGINELYIAEKMKGGLEALTVPQKDGGSRYEDQFVRRQWMELLLKIRGDFAPEKIETSHKQVTIVIDSNMIKALKDTGSITSEEVDIIDVMPEEAIGLLTEGKDEPVSP